MAICINLGVGLNVKQDLGTKNSFGGLVKFIKD
jgi:hypothetical protein